MENASKALTMAGGILIALLIISLVVIVFYSASNNFKSQDEIEKVEQIAAFNKEYESYNKKLLRGAEVVSVGNKAISNNVKYSDVPERHITITFQMCEKFVYHYEIDDDGRAYIRTTTKTFRVGQRYIMNNELAKLKQDSEAFSDFKRRVFNCTEITYNNTTGLIRSMHFEEQAIDYTEGL